MTVRMDRENANYYVIETTMIGRYSFSDAANRGAKNSRMCPHMQNGDDLYDLVTVSDARQKGILPLPWH